MYCFETVGMSLITSGQAAKSLEADAVVMSLGVRSVNNLVEELATCSNIFVLGEAEKAGQRIPHAVHRAFELANQL